MKSSPFCRSSVESFSKSASAVSAGDRDLEAVLPVRRSHEVDQRSDVVASHQERHHRRVAVLRDERLVAGGVVAPRDLDESEPLAVPAERAHFRPKGGVVDRAAIRAHDDDLARRRLRREALLDERLRLLRLRVARDIPVARQRVAQQERDQDDRREHGHEPRGECPPRMTGTGTRETLGGERHALSSRLLPDGELRSTVPRTRGEIERISGGGFL
jgi:hypothetical protein